MQRALLVTGLLLALAGIALGLIHTWTVEHRARLEHRDDWADVVAAARTGGDWQARAQARSEALIAATRTVDAHTHGTNMGLLVILLALLYPLLEGGSRWPARLAGAFAAGAWIYPLGLLLQRLGPTLAGEAVAAAGAGLAVAAFAALLVRLHRALSA